MRFFAKRRFGSLVRPELASALRETLLVEKPNVLQSQALPVTLGSSDVVCVAQTGAGKTLIFLLPLLEQLAASACSTQECHRPCAPSALVIAPSRELAMQHFSVAEKLAEKLPRPPEVMLCPAIKPPRSAECYLSSLMIAQPEHILARVADGSLDTTHLRTVAIDEADAVLCAGPYEERLSAQGETSPLDSCNS